MLGVIETGSWLDYPGFELWRFFNLFLFIGAGIFLHWYFGQPLRKKFSDRRKSIQLELQTAREQRDLALARLAEVEERLRNLDSETAAIRAEAEAEAEAERKRIRLSTDEDIEKLKQQARKEIASASKSAQLELRRFAAHESVRLAEAGLRGRITADDDARLIGISVERLGGN